MKCYIIVKSMSVALVFWINPNFTHIHAKWDVFSYFQHWLHVINSKVSTTFVFFNLSSVELVLQFPCKTLFEIPSNYHFSSFFLVFCSLLPNCCLPSKLINDRWWGSCYLGLKVAAYWEADWSSYEQSNYARVVSNQMMIDLSEKKFNLVLQVWGKAPCKLPPVSSFFRRSSE